MADLKEECEEFTTSVCLIIDAACLLVGLLIIVGFKMAVMTITFALPLHFFEALWVAKKCKFIRIQFQKLTNCCYNYHNHLGNSLQFLIIPFHILSSKLVHFSPQRLNHFFALILALRRTSIKKLSALFSQVSFSRDAGYSVQSSASLL